MDASIQNRSPYREMRLLLHVGDRALRVTSPAKCLTAVLLVALSSTFASAQPNSAPPVAPPSDGVLPASAIMARSERWRDPSQPAASPAQPALPPPPANESAPVFDASLFAVQAPTVAAASFASPAPTVPSTVIEPPVSPTEFTAVLRRLEATEQELHALRAAQGRTSPILTAGALQPLQAAPEVPPLTIGDNLPGNAAGGVSDSDATDETPEEFYGGGALNSGRPTIRLRGRILGDTMYKTQDADNVTQVGQFPNAFGFRQLRLGAQGTAYDNLIYQVDFDYAAAGRPSIRSTYLGVTDLPFLGVLYMGYVKEPFSLEEMPSEEHITFMERSLANAFVPARQAGFKFQNHSENKRATFSSGLFYDATDDYGTHIGDNGRASTTRFTWLPWYDEASGGRYLLHLGAGMSYRHPSGNIVSYSSRPEIQAFRSEAGDNTVPNFVNTNDIAARGVTLFDAEAAMVLGRLSIQSEYIMSRVNRTTAGGVDVNFWGAYIQAGYFLTGEHRPYDRTQGIFTRVRPFERFFFVESGGKQKRLLMGSGAWELAARISHLDLNNKNIVGGRLTDATFGINWFWNPRTRMEFNYIHAMLNSGGVQGNADLFATRFQFTF